jgi:hypothetical protein
VVRGAAKDYNGLSEETGQVFIAQLD